MRSLFCTLPAWIALSTAVPATDALAARGDILKMEKGWEISLPEITAQRKLNYPAAPGTPTSGVTFYKITYETVDAQGAPLAATGLMIVPAAAGAHSLVSFQHGTLFAKNEAPSSAALYRNKGLDGWSMAALFGSLGYVVSAPDYVGLGDSGGAHPYCHAQSESTAGADLLRAVRKAADSLSVPLNEKLFLTGYSEGGHATMALHRYLETELPQEFQVTASTPMGGPYDLSGTSWSEVLQQPTEHSAAEALYLLHSMEIAYALPGLMSEALRPEYLSAALPLLDGNHNAAAVVAALDKLSPTGKMTPKDLLNSDFVAATLAPRSNHRFIQALAKNDVFSWKPRAPIELVHSKEDFEVPFDNATLALQAIQAEGGKAKLVIVPGDHAQAALPAFVESLRWLRQF